LASAGNSIAASSAMMAMTTSNSINVNPARTSGVAHFARAPEFTLIFSEVISIARFYGWKDILKNCCARSDPG